MLLETLSIIAYKQPVTKAEIEKSEVSSEHAVSKLVEYNLVQELGEELDAPGRPLCLVPQRNF